MCVDYGICQFLFSAHLALFTSTCIKVTNNAREGSAVKRVSTVSNVCAFVSVLFFCLTFFLGGVGKQLAPGATGPQATSLKGDLLPLAPCPPNQRQAEKTKLTHTRTRVWASWLNSTCCRAWLHVWQTCNDAQFCKSVKLSQAQQQALLQQMQSNSSRSSRTCSSIWIWPKHFWTLEVCARAQAEFQFAVFIGWKLRIQSLRACARAWISFCFQVNFAGGCSKLRCSCLSKKKKLLINPNFDQQLFWRQQFFDVNIFLDVSKLLDVKNFFEVNNFFDVEKFSTS